MFEGDNAAESLCYRASLLYITRGFLDVGIQFQKKTHAGRRQGAKDLHNAG